MRKKRKKINIAIISIILSIIILGITIINLVDRINTELRIKENLIEEINSNIMIIDNFKSLNNSYAEGGQFTIGRLEYTYLEKFNDLPQSSSEKNGINILIRQIKDFNRLMDIVAETVNDNSYLVSRRMNIDKLCENGNIIEQNLKLLKKRI